MTLINNSESFHPNASGNLISNLRDSFEAGIDGVLLSLGRDITIFLPPQKSPCTSADCTFNSTYRRYMGKDGKVCETCRGQGYILDTRETIYRANIRWTNEPFDESDSIKEKFEAGRVGFNFCRTKTKHVSFNHIRQSIGANIDGINVELLREPRQTGFGDSPLLYVVAWWRVVGR